MAVERCSLALAASLLIGEVGLFLVWPLPWSCYGVNPGLTPPGQVPSSGVAEWCRARVLCSPEWQPHATFHLGPVHLTPNHSPAPQTPGTLGTWERARGQQGRGDLAHWRRASSLADAENTGSDCTPVHLKCLLAKLRGPAGPGHRHVPRTLWEEDGHHSHA